MDSFQESYYLSHNEYYDDDYYSEGGVGTLAEIGMTLLLETAIKVAMSGLNGFLKQRIVNWSAKKVKNNLGKAIQDVFNIIKDREVTTGDIKNLRKATNKVTVECNRYGATELNYTFTGKELEAFGDLKKSCGEISQFIRSKRVLKKDQARFGDRLKNFIECGIKCLEIVEDKPN